MSTAAVAPAKEIVRLRDLGQGRRDAIMIDPRIIEVESGHNPRNYNLPENRAHLDELKASIKANGTLSPLWVRYDNGSKKAILVDGECRLRANLELIAEGVEIQTVPCLQVQGGNEAERLVLALTANTGKPLSKWESGTAFMRLMRFGWTEEQISARMGQSVRFIKEAVELADAPEDVKKMLSEQAITPSLAISELRKLGEKATETLRVKAAEAKATGKVAKRDRAKNNVSLRQLVQDLLETVNQNDFMNHDRDTVKVSKIAVRRLQLALK